MTIISLASRSPRCLNCKFWTPTRGPAGDCGLLDPELTDTQTDRDWHCEAFQRSTEERGT